MRGGWQADASYANLICGPNTQSHAHRDQGSLVLFNQEWLAADANLYSSSGLSTDEFFHNLVRFERRGQDVKQDTDHACELLALQNTAHYLYTAINLTPTLKPRLGLERLEREVLFIKPDTWVVFDRSVSSYENPRHIWSLNLSSKPTIEGQNLRHTVGKGRLDVLTLNPIPVERELHSYPSEMAGFTKGFRVDEVSQSASSHFLHVMAAQGAVSRATRSEDDGHVGATLQLRDGRQIRVNFSKSNLGGTLYLGGPEQENATMVSLKATIAKLPLFTP